MGLFNFLSRKEELQPPAEPEKRTLVKEDFTVVGAVYHKEEIALLKQANPDWKKSGKTLVSEGKVMQKIYHYSYVNKPVKIIPDDGSVYEKGALMVYIAGEHVGYIPDDMKDHVASILANRSIKYISAFIGGGEYKVVSNNGDAVKWDEHIRISVRIAYS